MAIIHYIPCNGEIYREVELADNHQFPFHTLLGSRVSITIKKSVLGQFVEQQHIALFTCPIDLFVAWDRKIETEAAPIRQPFRIPENTGISRELFVEIF
ncbi:MAG TPA: hypothetical protein ENH60_02250 [Pricia sp.]|uniref:Uncharacterized protein n=1 Tax=Pricia antarctica TaxID=641691 RepID=A0A831VSK0_9FLAO|nr:hypothetical protein [Pricia sp.]HEA22818.1 hypothetical protein [Pricia antarctica]